MENFFKTLETIGEVCAAVADEIDRNESRRRQELTEETFGSEVPRPSAPSYAAESVVESLARHPSVSSGYGSGSSSSNSSRRNSDLSIDDEVYRNETRVVASTSPTVATARRSAPSSSISPAEALLGAVAVGALAVGTFYAGKALFKKKNVLIETFEECEPILKEIKKDAQQHPVIGLDCQWVRWGSHRSPVALLQLSSFNGHVALIQLQKIGMIPSDLRDLLANRNIIKAGIETLQDAIYLEDDYGLIVQGTFDLRFLARDTGHQPGGLKRLAKDILGIDIGQDVEIMASDWEQDPLDEEQTTYAESAVKASFDIFEKLIHEMFWVAVMQRAREYVKPFLDKKFR